MHLSMCISVYASCYVHICVYILFNVCNSMCHSICIWFYACVSMRLVICIWFYASESIQLILWSWFFAIYSFYAYNSIYAFNYSCNWSIFDYVDSFVCCLFVSLIFITKSFGDWFMVSCWLIHHVLLINPCFPFDWSMMSFYWIMLSFWLIHGVLVIYLCWKKPHASTKPRVVRTPHSKIFCQWLCLRLGHSL